MRKWSLVLGCLVLGGAIGTFAGRSFLQGQPPAAPSELATPKELTSYRHIVKRVLPAVVSIEARTKVSPVRRSRPAPFDEQQIPEEFRRFFPDFPRKAPRDFQRESDDGDLDEGPNRLGFGSGFIVDPKGIIMTNNHVVEGADSVEVQLADGRKFVSTDIKKDPKTDLAIVRVKTKSDLPWLEMGDSSAMEIGDRVLAVGAPFGLRGTVTHGIISAKGRALHMNLYEDFLQTDAAINPGNSGGPLINLEGKVIGINAAIKSRSGGWQGIGLAIPSNMAKNVMQQLEKNGVVHRGYLGVQIKDLVDAEVAERLGVNSNGGVLVTRVFDKTPGARAGLQDGDVIVSIDGTPIKDGRQLQNTVARLPVGKTVKMEIVRDGKPKTLDVKLDEQPEDFGAAQAPARSGPSRNKSTTSIDKIGVEAADLTPETARSLGFEKTEGAVIARVKPGSVAAENGLRKGMLITKVDRKPVHSAAELEKALASASLKKGVLLQVETVQGGTNYVLLQSKSSARDF